MKIIIILLGTIILAHFVAQVIAGPDAILYYKIKTYIYCASIGVLAGLLEERKKINNNDKIYNQESDRGT